MTRFLCALVLSAAGLLLAADAAHAQRGRGGYHGGYYHGGYYPRVSIGVGFGYYGPYYPYYGVPRVAYYYPPTAVAVAPIVPVVAAVPETAPPTAGSNASLRVLVPDPGAVLLFDGNRTNQTGTERLFHTPPLVADANNSYRIRAMWQQSGKQLVQERVVNVSPGQNVTIDFTQPVSEPLPAPLGK